MPLLRRRRDGTWSNRNETPPGSLPALEAAAARQNRRMVPDEVAAYGREVAASLQEVLGDDLVGAYYVGSIALGGYVAGESDLDVVAVSERAIPDREKPSLADAVFDTTVSCPA